MQNRWFHRPTLHSPSAGNERKVGWLELFYDLVYLAVIFELASGLHRDPTLLRFLAFGGLLLPIWFTWTGFTFYSNRFVVDDLLHRCVVFLQMFGMAAVAVFAPHVLDGETTGFALAYTAVRAVHILFYARAYLQVDSARDMNRRYIIGFASGLVLWASSSLVPSPWVYLLWATAMFVDLSTVLSRDARDLTGRYPPDVLHMSERYGLITIIVLGISFVKVLSRIGAYEGTHGVSASMMVMASLAFLPICCLWWIYFDDVAGSRIRRGPLAPIVWIYGHLPLTIAIAALSVALEEVVVIAPLASAADTERWLLCGALALTLASVGIIDAVTERRQSELSDRQRVNMRIGSAVFVLLLAPAGEFMPAWAFVGLVVLCCLVQVFFDLSMAPLALHPQAAERQDPAVFQSARTITGETPTPRWRRGQIGSAIRRGVPNELKQDLYVHFMEGSWTRIFVALALLFVITNVIFAALYLLEPGSISNLRSGSFLDAFAFSVETMATIGYGAMAPSTSYAHILVTIEALISILGVALATGLLFAKASRPRASVLFSKVAVIHVHDGQPTLSFRVGNARGNELVEASIRVSVACEEISREGHRMRRLHDLPLARDMTPLFVLSWTVMHRIDESSPFHGATAENLESRFISLIVMLTGHDSAFSQTTHTRMQYYPEDIRLNHRFVDVLSETEEGRAVLDFEHFHETVPETLQPEEDTA